jgi:hypothetical protein
VTSALEGVISSRLIYHLKTKKIQSCAVLFVGSIILLDGLTRVTKCYSVYLNFEHAKSVYVIVTL